MIPSIVSGDLVSDWKAVLGDYEFKETDHCQPVRNYHMLPRITTPMGTDPQTLDLLAMLVNFLEPRVVVEAGTYMGHFAITIAAVLKQINDGAVLTADTTDHCKVFREDPKWAALWFERILYWNGDYADMLKRIDRPIDFAFIDASSLENPHLRREHFEATWPRMSSGGVIAVHDTLATDWEDAQWFRDQANLHLPKQRGLTLIQKP